MTIESSVFQNCSSLTSITIPNSITVLDINLFRNCTNLSSVTLGNNLTKIGNAAFRDCSSLKHILIPSTVTTIDSSAFNGCTSLTSIIIPASVTSVNYYAFANCSQLKIYYRGSDTSAWSSSWNPDNRPLVSQYNGLSIEGSEYKIAFGNVAISNDNTDVDFSINTGLSSIASITVTPKLKVGTDVSNARPVLLKSTSGGTANFEYGNAMMSDVRYSEIHWIAIGT